MASERGLLRRLGFLFEGLLVVFVFGALRDLGRRLFGLEEPFSSGRFLLFSLALAVLVVLCVALGLRARDENFHDLGLSRERYAPALAFALGLAGGIVVASVGFGLDLARALAELPSPRAPYAIESGWDFTWYVFAGLLLFGLCEELVIRGYAFRRLEEGFSRSGRGAKAARRRATLWSALLLSALVGFAHASEGWTGQVLHGAQSLALFGVYLLSKRDLGVVLVAHATAAAVEFWFVWKATG